VLAAPQPGASCKVAGRERVTTAGTLRCASSPARGLRWRLVSASQATTTPSSTIPATTTTAPASSSLAPRVSNVVADSTEVRFSLSGMSPDTNNYAVQWVQQGASFTAYQMVRSTSKSVSISAQTFRCDRTYTFRVFTMRSDWTLSQGHTNQNVTPHSDTFDVTMSHPCVNTAAGGSSTLTCAQGGTCVVGDTGPGGGIVFYVHASGTFSCGRSLTSTCKYLEAAPTSGTSSWADSGYVWSGNTGTEIGATAQGTAVGTGYRNTLAIVDQSSTASRAATISRAYRGPNNQTDWYLPSRSELQEMFTRRSDIGISAGFFWSSTEDNLSSAYYGDFSAAPWYSAGSGKSNSQNVRPIRAFGGTLACADGGTCVVGDTGPGGGVVFYVHSDADNVFTSAGSDCYSQCKYLEVAPAGAEVERTWSTDTDPGVGRGNQAIAVSGADDDAIGSGYQNTVDINAQSGNLAASSAAVYAFGYANNEKTDWHLSSRSELNELCKYARTQTTGDTAVECSTSGPLRSGFASDYYWASTERSATSARIQDFSNGSRTTDGAKEFSTGKVRPIRAFGTTTSCALGAACAVGDTGPGGGTVFYVASSNFTSTGSDCGTACRYLEAASSDSSSGTDWCSDNGTSLGVTATSVGSGMANTTTAASTCASGAIRLAADYSNNSKTDWHLPSKDELNELCKYAKNTGQAAGAAVVCSGGSDAALRGFIATTYWSSSEDSTFNAWQHSFFDGSRGANLKGAPTSNRVRAVRAFG